MQRELIVTADGSHTMSIPSLHVTYHSKHGAVQESMHVFIEAGLKYLLQKSPSNYFTPTNPLQILEIGYGTGLNALLSWQIADAYQCALAYTGLELYPLSHEETSSINYGEKLQMTDAFAQLNNCAWNIDFRLSDYFSLHKVNDSLFDYATAEHFHVIYFDAFSPSAQPEMWTVGVFQKMFDRLLPGGILLTYCSKTVVRNAMKAVGFTVTKIPGPYGKREMVRAIKEGTAGYP